MMKQILVTAFLSVVALCGLTEASQAKCGLFSRRGCNSGCDTPCASAPCAPCAAPAPAPVQYEERKVKVLKPVYKEKEVEVLVCKNVMQEQKYNYVTMVPAYRTEKRMINECTPKYTEVEYVYTAMVPRVMEKKVQCTTYKCTTENVVEQVPVCKIVCSTYVDECGRCCTRRERVTVMENVTRCVVRREPIVTEQVVKYTVCEPVQQKGKKMVCEFVNTQREITVQICTMERQEKVGVRMVCVPMTEKVKQMVRYCEMVETEQVIRVPVSVPCATPCNTGCNDCGVGCDSGHGHRRGGLFSGGLFRRGGGGCCN